MNYKKIANNIRKTVLKMVFEAQTSHIGSNFSAIDILTVLFEKINLKQDKLIISKGWVAASIYAFLERKGYISKKDLESFCQSGSKFIGLIEPLGLPGCEFSGGSMGYGLPAGVGFALAKRLKNEQGKVYVLMSDGEQAIGTTWESALIAAHHKLDNLVVIVDDNGFQAMGRVEEILSTRLLQSKWRSFDWGVATVNGHNYKLIEQWLKNANKYKGKYWEGLPKCIIAETIKGKGVSFMENNNEWHYRQLDKRNYELAKKELG